MPLPIQTPPSSARHEKNCANGRVEYTSTTNRGKANAGIFNDEFNPCETVRIVDGDKMLDLVLQRAVCARAGRLVGR